MYKTQCLLAFVALYVGLAHSWEFAVSVDDRLEFYINDTKTDTVHLDSQNPSALAYDEVHDILLYVDKQSGNDVICGYNISFVEYKCYMKRSGRDIQGLAFDPITQYLFFTDTKEKSINWLSFQHGSKSNDNGNLLIKLDEGIPTDIAVDSCRGYIYWIKTNLTTSTIERARFDGSDREVVIYATYKMDLHSLAICQQTKKIYWFMVYGHVFTGLETFLHSADLDGKNKNMVMKFQTPASNLIAHPNILTVSKKNVFVIDWCSACHSRQVWKFLTPSIPYSDCYLRVNNTEGAAGIVANHKIAEQFEGIQECQSLSSPVPHNTLKIAREYEGPFCVHGVKVNGQSLCKCTPGYTGERCDASVCENYCIHGSCSFNDVGLHECRCNAGYTGDRCEVNSCLGYCLNNGTCSLNADGEPVCTCIDDYAGDRCEVADCLNYCFQGECSFYDGVPECRVNNTEGAAGIVANHKIAEQFEGIQECQSLSSPVPHNTLKIAREYEGPFCVHGVKVNGQSLCKCTPGYTGERCDVSVCENYCIHGSCSFNDVGLHECRCNAGYTGDRCEVNSCLGYCLNNGTCSLNADGGPVCTCIDDYAGDRCEVADCLNYCFQGECSFYGGVPECRCNTGYTGARCEVNSCLGYCLNNGSCSLDEEGEPSCKCLDDYTGDRCELNNANAREDKNSNLLTTPAYYPALSNITLADLFANWRKPVAIIPVFVVEAKR